MKVTSVSEIKFLQDLGTVEYNPLTLFISLHPVSLLLSSPVWLDEFPQDRVLDPRRLRAWVGTDSKMPQVRQ